MECPESIEELLEIERMLPLCRKEIYEQAKARIESGVACSISEASRQISEELEKDPESIRRSIQREQQNREGVILSHLTDTDKYRPVAIATKWTGDQESYTPTEYIESSRLVMGSIDLDPASNEKANKIVKATQFFDKNSDGLTKAWEGNIFLNPPYSQPEIKHFIDRLLSHYQLNRIQQAILLTNNNTDTMWFHKAAKVSGIMCFTKGRINFLKPDNSRSSPTNGQIFFYFGPNKNEFKTEFKQYGLILTYDDSLS